MKPYASSLNLKGSGVHQLILQKILLSGGNDIKYVNSSTPNLFYHPKNLVHVVFLLSFVVRLSTVARHFSSKLSLHKCSTFNITTQNINNVKSSNKFSSHHSKIAISLSNSINMFKLQIISEKRSQIEEESS